MIRKATERDLPQVIYINRVELPENYPFSFFEYVLKLNPELFYVAEFKGKIIGYVMAQLEDSNRRSFLIPAPELIGKGKIVHLLSIAVLEEYQRRGVGSLLLERVIESSKKLEASRIYLEVRVSNTRAQNLYRKYGFKILTKLAAYYMDGEDAYVMVKDL